MKLKEIKIQKNDIVHVVIETPQYSSDKYFYNPELKTFSFEKTLAGNAFPFDFGFVPNTLCDDGAPISALVLMEGETYPGCVLAARLVGILEATESDKDHKPIRNDRLIAVSIESRLYEHVTDIDELDEKMINKIEEFFIGYNKEEGKVFKPLKWNNAKAAHKKILSCRE